MTFSQDELHMWSDDPGERSERADDRAINERYIRGEGRIVIESNWEKLPGFINQLKNPGYMDLRPFYQRRPPWDPGLFNAARSAVLSPLRHTCEAK